MKIPDTKIIIIHAKIITIHLNYTRIRKMFVMLTLCVLCAQTLMLPYAVNHPKHPNTQRAKKRAGKNGIMKNPQKKIP